jgi:uncharacterized protein YndB with AHSA1/START domain
MLMTNRLPQRTNSTTCELKVERDFDAPPQAVFDAYLAMHGDQHQQQHDAPCRGATAVVQEREDGRRRRAPGFVGRS